MNETSTRNAEKAGTILEHIPYPPKSIPSRLRASNQKDLDSCGMRRPRALMGLSFMTIPRLVLSRKLPCFHPGGRTDYKSTRTGPVPRFQKRPAHHNSLQFREQHGNRYIRFRGPKMPRCHGMVIIHWRRSPIRERDQDRARSEPDQVVESEVTLTDRRRACLRDDCRSG